MFVFGKYNCYLCRRGLVCTVESFDNAVYILQEIDGQSLLLLKRSDVLQGLSLRLGPALKIYNHVMKLQTSTQSVS